MLPAMLETARRRKDHQFVVAAAPGIEPVFYERFLEGQAVNCVYGETYDLLASASAAMVTSGTATLETALFGVPQVVCYKGSWLSYHIARHLVNVEFIALANLIAGKEVVKELIQAEFNTENLKEELIKILQPEKRRQIQEGYALIRRRLGQPGASRRVARLIVEYMRQGQQD